MALTYSSPMPIGTPAPTFSLPDTISGKTISLDALPSAPATVIMFICNHCPYVKHLGKGIVTVSNSYQTKGVNFIAISANDVEQYPVDAPEKMQEYAAALSFNFPYLYDASQSVAKAYHAQCTPEFYIFDKNLQCAYHGRFDASSPSNNIPVTGEDFTAALDAVLSGKPAPQPQQPSMGCNIKWKRSL